MEFFLENNVIKIKLISAQVAGFNDSVFSSDNNHTQGTSN